MQQPCHWVYRNIHGVNHTLVVILDNAFSDSLVTCPLILFGGAVCVAHSIVATKIAVQWAGRRQNKTIDLGEQTPWT
jgi:hypothetical protein